LRGSVLALSGRSKNGRHVRRAAAAATHAVPIFRARALMNAVAAAACSAAHMCARACKCACAGPRARTCARACVCVRACTCAHVRERERARACSCVTRNYAYILHCRGARDTQICIHPALQGREGHANMHTSCLAGARGTRTYAYILPCRGARDAQICIHPALQGREGQATMHTCLPGREGRANMHTSCLPGARGTCKHAYRLPGARGTRKYAYILPPRGARDRQMCIHPSPHFFFLSNFGCFEPRAGRGSHWFVRFSCAASKGSKAKRCQKGKENLDMEKSVQCLA